MRSLINRATECFDKNVEVEWLTPNEVSEFLAENGWTLSEITTGNCYNEENHANYINDASPNVALTMKWNGWTGQVELVATHMEEEDPLMKGLRKVLLTTHNVVEYQNYDFVEISTFIENKDWKLYKATATFQPGWCHYIYSNDKYSDRRLVLACDLEHKITTLWTISSDLMEDE